MIIGIVVAMKEEIIFLEKQLAKIAVNLWKNEKITSWKYGETTIILQVVGVGKVNSAINTQLLLEKYKLDFLINIGTSLSLKKEVPIGTLCLIKQAFYYDVDLTAFNYQYGQLPNLPVGYDCYDQIDSKFIHTNNVSLGNIASGDTFINKISQVKDIQKKILNEILVLDMEATAISQVAHINNCPLVVFKVISDNIMENTSNEQQFQQNLVMVSAKLASITIVLIDELINSQKRSL